MPVFVRFEGDVPCAILPLWNSIPAFAAGGESALEFVEMKTFVFWSSVRAMDFPIQIICLG